MRIVSASIRTLSLPLNAPFRHALAKRACSDAMIVCVTDETGAQGFGEAAPRPYVTGETRATCQADIRALINAFDPAPLESSPAMPSLKSLARCLAIPVGPSARCAVETALIDLMLRSRQRPMADLLPPCRTEVVYSGVIGAGTMAHIEQAADRCRGLDLKAVKIKACTLQDVDKIARAREILGDTVSIRVDANAAFSIEDAQVFLASVAPLAVACVEQPIPPDSPPALAALRAASPVPIMADESLLSLNDAQTLIRLKAVDSFNIRLSKCGGLAQAQAIAVLAAQAGLGVQIGCHVGETAILSAAGRHVAASLPSLLYAEGSYGEFLLEQDIASVSIAFGLGGRAPLLTGPGLGITIDNERLACYTADVTTIKINHGGPWL